MSKKTNRIRGIKAKVLDKVRLSDGGLWTTDIIGALPEFDHKQVTAAAATLVREGTLIKEGVRGCWLFKCARKSDQNSKASEDGVDVIENLLNAMAEAEPLLRQLQAAQKAFTQYHKEQG